MKGEKFEDKWYTLKIFLKNYREEKCQKSGDYAEYGRYCVALSIDDILEKMKEIEENVK